jgi:hypothetical protein
MAKPKPAVIPDFLRSLNRATEQAEAAGVSAADWSTILLIRAVIVAVGVAPARAEPLRLALHEGIDTAVDAVLDNLEAIRKGDYLR